MFIFLVANSYADEIVANMIEGENCPAYDSMKFLEGAQLVKERFLDFFQGSDKSRVCLLDEKLDTDLCPEDSDSFDFFLFGGILGNVDEMDADRTKVLRMEGYSGRKLGTEQMTTPTAVSTTRKILHDKIKFEDLKFVDRPEFETEYEGENLILPFRYLANTEGDPIVTEGVLDILKKDLDWDLSELS